MGPSIYTAIHPMPPKTTWLTDDADRLSTETVLARLKQNKNAFQWETSEFTRSGHQTSQIITELFRRVTVDDHCRHFTKLRALCL